MSLLHHAASEGVVSNIVVSNMLVLKLHLSDGCLYQSSPGRVLTG